MKKFQLLPFNTTCYLKLNGILYILYQIYLDDTSMIPIKCKTYQEVTKKRKLLTFIAWVSICNTIHVSTVSTSLSWWGSHRATYRGTISFDSGIRNHWSRFGRYFRTTNRAFCCKSSPFFCRRPGGGAGAKRLQ